MPFCHQCGTAVHDADVFCWRCGKQQPVSASAAGAKFAAGPPPPSPNDPLASVPPRTASILCYVPGIGWIASIVVLASDRYRREPMARFHAFQGLYLFVAWLMADWVLRPLSDGMMMPHIHLYRIVEAVLLGMSIFMMIKTAQNERFSLPIFGDLADRSMAGN